MTRNAIDLPLISMNFECAHFWKLININTRFTLFRSIEVCYLLLYRDTRSGFIKSRRYTITPLVDLIFQFNTRMHRFPQIDHKWARISTIVSIRGIEISIILAYSNIDLFNRQGIFNRTIKAIPLQSRSCSLIAALECIDIDRDFIVQNRKIEYSNRSYLTLSCNGIAFFKASQ